MKSGKREFERVCDGGVLLLDAEWLNSNEGTTATIETYCVEPFNFHKSIRIFAI